MFDQRNIVEIILTLFFKDDINYCVWIMINAYSSETEMWEITNISLIWKPCFHCYQGKSPIKTGLPEKKSYTLTLYSECRSHFVVHFSLSPVCFVLWPPFVFFFSENELIWMTLTAVLPSYFGLRCWLLCCIGPSCQITSSVWLWICCHVYYSLTSEIHFQVKCFSSYRVIVVSQFNQNVTLTFIWNTLNFLWLLEVLLTLIPIKILKLPMYQNCMLINLMKLPAN